MSWKTNRAFVAWLIPVLICAVAVGRGNAAGDSSPKPKLGNRGISTMFIKRKEIMDRDSYGSDSRPLPPEKAVENLLRYDVIGMASLVSTHNRSAWKLLRQKHPEVLALYYQCGVSARIEASGLTYFKYGDIESEWYLLDDEHDPARSDPRNRNNRIRWSTSRPKSPDYNRFYFDVGNKEFQVWAAERICEHVSGKSQGITHGYDGFMMDNVSIGAERMLRIDNYHPGWKYKGKHKEWNDAFFEYLRMVHRKLNKEGHYLIANHTLNLGSDVDAEYWPEFLDCVDGAMSEQALGYGSERYTGKKWLTGMAHHEQVIKKGVIDWWVWYPPKQDPEGHKDFMYGYCSWLLVREPGLSLFQATRGDPGYANPNPPWYKEYDLLGLPTSHRRPLGECWVRDYGDARVVVNPTLVEQEVAFEDGVRRSDSTTNQAGTRSTMPPVSGRMFLAVP